MKTRTCRGECGETLPINQFYRIRKGEEKRAYVCKSCDNKRRGPQVIREHQHQVGKVYVKVCEAVGHKYVGSTTLTIRKRDWCHKTEANAGKDTPLYNLMRLYPDAWTTEVLEVCPGLTDEELREREQHWIDQIRPELNINNAIKESR